MTHNEPFFPVLASPNSREITKLILNNNTSICISTTMLFAMISKVRKKQNNLKINLEGGGLNKLPKSGRSPALSEDLAGQPVKGGQKVGVRDYPETWRNAPQRGE